MKLFNLKNALLVTVLALGLGFVAQQAHAYVNLNWALLNTDPYCPHRPGCHEQIHKVFLTAGTTYQIDMMSSQFDAYLFLESMNGQVLAQNDDGGVGLNARIFFTPTYSGNYNVVATSYSPGATGGYTLIITP